MGSCLKDFCQCCVQVFSLVIFKAESSQAFNFWENANLGKCLEKKKLCLNHRLGICVLLDVEVTRICKTKEKIMFQFLDRAD